MSGSAFRINRQVHSDAPLKDFKEFNSTFMDPSTNGKGSQQEQLETIYTIITEYMQEVLWFMLNNVNVLIGIILVVVSIIMFISWKRGDIDDEEDE